MMGFLGCGLWAIGFELSAKPINPYKLKLMPYYLKLTTYNFVFRPILSQGTGLTITKQTKTILLIS
jgi:hypothetical protein